MKEIPSEANCRPLLEGDRETFDHYFFPDNYSKAVIQMAKRICDNCIVREECLEVALEEGAQYGIFGGLTPPERARMLTGSGDAA